MNSLLRNPICRGAMVGMVCALLCYGLNRTALVRGLENWALDACIVFRGQRSSDANVVIVAIDDDSLETLGKPPVFISPEMGKVVTFLHDHGAASIGVDFMIPDSTETIADLMWDGQGSAELMGQAVGRSGNVVLPEWMIPGEPPRTPIYEWQAFPEPGWANLGFVNLTVDADTIARRQRLRAGSPEDPQPCLALAAFGRANGMPDEWFYQHQLRLDGKPIPVDAGGSLLINFVGPPGTIDSVPFHQVLAAADGRGTLDRSFDGAVVLIGTTNSAQSDWQSTPYVNQSIAQLLRSSLLDRKAALMPGVEVHANLVATLIDRAFITTPWWLSTPLLLLIVGAALGAAFARLSLEAGAALAFAHHCLWRVVALLAFSYGEYRVEVVAMLALGIVVYGVTFALRWRWIRRMMGMVKSEAVARALESDPSKLDLKGEELRITVLFTDVRNFTSFSETHSPQHVVRLLNAYFSAIVPIIEAQGGIVNQYLGDGLMAIFGAPNVLADHAGRGALAAAQIVERVHDLDQRWSELGAADFRIGVGVHTGPAVVGTVGSPRRLDYTAIGDTVNTAARIEAGNKQLGTEILLSQATVEGLPDQVREQLRLGEAMILSVKGKEDQLTVYPAGGAGEEAGFS